MSLTQELDDACDDLGSKIILTTNALEEDILPNITLSSNQLSTPPQTFLRVGKPGKLFLKPNYTAFTKTNLGSIPSKVEKTLLKTEESIPITLTLNKHVQKINIPEKGENFSRSFSTSYSSRGYGVGFVSKVPRFNYDRKIIYPGPGDYSPEKKDSMEERKKKLEKRYKTSLRLSQRKGFETRAKDKLMQRLQNFKNSINAGDTIKKEINKESKNNGNGNTLLSAEEQVSNKTNTNKVPIKKEVDLSLFMKKNKDDKKENK